MLNFINNIKEKNIVEVFSLIYKKRVGIFILLVSVSLFCGSIILSLPAEYSSKEILICEDTEKLDIPENLFLMLSVAGVKLPEPKSEDSFSPLLYSEIIKSSSFVDELLREKIFLSSVNKNVTIKDYFVNYYDLPWWKSFFTTELSHEEIRDELSDLMKVNFDDVNGLIYVYASMQDPYVAQQVVKLISAKLTHYIDQYRSGKALNEYNFYNQQLEQAYSYYLKAKEVYVQSVQSDVDASLPSVQLYQEQLSQKMDLAYKVYQFVESQKANAYYKYTQKKTSISVVSDAIVDIRPQIPNTFIIFLVFMLEVCVLFVLEYSAWHTLYTPLFCLMLPYTLVLILTLLLIPVTDLVAFYYPSIIIWIVGLPVFAIPSMLLGYSTTKLGVNERNVDLRQWDYMPKYLIYVAYVLGVLFLLRLYQTINSSAVLFGTDEFADEYCGGGIWGHLREVCNALMILFLYHVSKKSWRLALPLFLLMIPSLLYMVKGWLIIPVVAAIIMKLYSGKLKLSIKLLSIALTSGFLLFLVVYMILPALGDEGAQTDSMMFVFVLEHFIHYLTSGTLGFSFDLELGATDTEDFKYLFSPIINIWSTLTGNTEMISPIPSKFFNTGYTYTNVRTFFGTLYLHCDALQFVFCTIGYSVFAYILMYFAKRRGDIFSYMSYFFFVTLFAMGWFEFYMWHLSVIEVPLILYTIGFVVKYLNNNSKTE